MFDEWWMGARDLVCMEPDVLEGGCLRMNGIFGVKFVFKFVNYPGWGTVLLIWWYWLGGKNHVTDSREVSLQGFWSSCDGGGYCGLRMGCDFRTGITRSSSALVAGGRTSYYILDRPRRLRRRYILSRVKSNFDRLLMRVHIIPDRIIQSLTINVVIVREAEPTLVLRVAPRKGKREKASPSRKRRR